MEAVIKERRGPRRAVLLGVPDCLTAARLAEHLDAGGFMPCLAFSRNHVVADLQVDRFRALVIHSCLLDDDLVSLIRIGLGGSDLPIVMLSSGEPDPAKAASADVDLELPENAVDELVESVSALAQMCDQTELPATIAWGPLTLDLRRRQGRWDGEQLDFTPSQFRIMEVLVLAAGAVVTTHDLSRRLWHGAVFNDGERMEAHIKRIRRKIDPQRSRRPFLLTVRGEGYRLAEFDLTEPVIDLAELELVDA